MVEGIVLPVLAILYPRASRDKIAVARRESRVSLDPHALPRFGGAFVWEREEKAQPAEERQAFIRAAKEAGVFIRP